MSIKLFLVEELCRPYDPTRIEGLVSAVTCGGYLGNQKIKKIKLSLILIQINTRNKFCYIKIIIIILTFIYKR